jgi:outer membrane protein OmpA-like peptidoglycan-associated protein
MKEPGKYGTMSCRLKPKAERRHLRVARILPLLFTFLFSLFSSLLTPLKAQDTAKWIARGDSAYISGDYQEAITYYEWAEKKSGDWHASWGLAKCWRALMNYPKAKEYYAKVVDQPGAPLETWFHYGQTLMAARDYPAAEQWFAKYATAAPNDPRTAAFQDLDGLVEAVMRDSSQYTVQRLPINSKWSDFSPTLYKDGILFVSARPNEVGVLHSSTIDDAPLLDLYFASVDSQGKWSRPKPFDPLNSKLNEGPVVVDTLSGSIFLTRNDPEHRKNRDQNAHKGLNRLRIDVFHETDGKISPSGALPFNNTRYAVGHPAVSPNSLLLFFASDMPGGFGGTDIYACKLEENGWGQPRNLGSMVNTAEDELFPSADAEGNLYFASNGHMGLGGLDIFTSQPTPDGSWSRAQNMGYPINSEADDFGMAVNAEGKGGYFSSNRKGEPGDDNIYAFQRNWPRFECASQIKNNYCFQFWETGIIDGDSLPLAYEWDFGDGTKARGLETRHCYEGAGVYHVQLNLIDTLQGFLFLTQVESELLVTDTQQVFIDCPDHIGVGEEFTVSAEKSILEGCTIEQHYWELGDGKRQTAPLFTHAYDTPGTYEIKLGVMGNPAVPGDFTCKNCVTKTIEVMPRAEIQEYRDSVQRAEERFQAEQLKLKRPDLVQNLLDAGTKEFDLRDSAKAGKYSVKLASGAEEIDTKSPVFKGIRDLREVRTADGFEVYSGLKDSLKDIRPYFVEAHRQGFDDAVVVVVKDPASDSRQMVTLPARKTGTGFTLFDGQFLDANGQPLQVEVTFEDIEKGLEVFKTTADSSGHVQMRLPNGKIYVWNADLKDYFPAAGYLDLVSLTEAPNGSVRLRERITMRPMSELLASGEPVRVNNIFFDFDRATLRPESQRQLIRLSELLGQYPDYGVVISAHTDNWGTDAYNITLSNHRAKSVVDYLTYLGFEKTRFRSEGFGESRPVVPNDTPENRQFNRRVEFSFYPMAPK